MTHHAIALAYDSLEQPDMAVAQFRQVCSTEARGTPRVVQYERPKTQLNALATGFQGAV